MSTYSAEQIIGKTLIANRAVNIYRLPDDKAKSVYTVNAGQLVGVVDSYISPSAQKNRKFLYWQFVDQNGKFFYVRHEEGAFNIKALKDQGALTTAEQNENISDFEKYFKKYGIPVLIGIGVLYLGGKYIQSRNGGF